MSDSFNLPCVLIVAQIDVDEIQGTGGVAFPLLLTQPRALFRGPGKTGRALHFREFRCHVSAFNGTCIAASSPTPVDVLVRDAEEFSNHPLHMEIPLDQTRLAIIERERKGGVERVLLQTGYGQIHFLELPAVPLEQCAELKEAFQALQQAQKLEREGHYVEAVGVCRKALEPFFQYVDRADEGGEKKRVPVLQTSWESRIGKAAYEYLNTSLLALKRPANEAVHIGSIAWGRLEAQMFILVTTAIVSYAVKTGLKVSP